jgi:hypothetical protein
MCATIPRDRREGDIAASRQPAELHGEENDHQQSEKEIRDRNPEHGDHHRELVDPRVVPQRRENAARQSQHQGDDQRIGRQRDRHGQPLQRHRHHVLAHQNGSPEIALQQSAVPAQQLHGEWLVQPEIFPDLFQLCWRGTHASNDRRGITGDEAHHPESDEADDQQHWQGAEYAAQNETCQCVLPHQRLISRTTRWTCAGSGRTCIPARSPARPAPWSTNRTGPRRPCRG